MYLAHDGILGNSYSHYAMVEDEDYDDLDLDINGMDDDGAIHFGLAADEYGDLCECNSNRS
jgi:hypothetical protein